jgi:hypothetical protein
MHKHENNTHVYVDKQLACARMHPCIHAQTQKQHTHVYVAKYLQHTHVHVDTFFYSQVCTYTQENKSAYMMGACMLSCMGTCVRLSNILTHTYTSHYIPHPKPLTHKPSVVESSQVDLTPFPPHISRPSYKLVPVPVCMWIILCIYRDICGHLPIYIALEQRR